METKMQIDRIRGSLIGGAMGDALGYPVEFIPSFEEIQAKYGEKGITRLDDSHWWMNDDGESGKAWISDDTQMTLFTACGTLKSGSRFSTEKVELGISENEFVKRYGKPLAREAQSIENNRRVDKLLYIEAVFRDQWVSVTTEFTFIDSKLVKQEVVKTELMYKHGNDDD